MFGKVNIEELFTSLFWGLTVMLWVNPLESDRVAVDSFDRQIGPGIVQNSDVSKIISNFNKWFLLLIMVFAVCYVILNLVRVTRNRSKEVWEYIQKWLPFAYVALVLKCINYFYTLLNEGDGSAFFSGNLVALILFMLLVYYITDAEKLIPFSMLEKILIGSIGCSIPFAMLFDEEGELWKTACIIFALCFLLLYGVFGFLSKRMKPEKVSKAGDVITVLMALFPTITFLYIETVNVLNQHEIFINRPFLWYQAGSICYLILIIVCAILTVGRFDGVIKDWKNLAYPLTVMGIQLMGIQFSLTAQYSHDLMESANYGVMISDFLIAGKIPVVETYGGHQLERVLSGVLYGVINGDYAGAVFSPYFEIRNVVIILLLYFVIKNILDRETAFLFVLFVPFYGNVYYWGMGLLIVLAFWSFMKKQSGVRIALLWLSCVFCVLYRLDLGYSFTLAMMLTLICYLTMEKKWNMVKKILIPLIVIGIAGVSLWFGICFAKDINPVSRLIEFLNISLSNHVWGRASLGNEGFTMYVVAYIFLPVLVLFSVALLLLKGKELRKERGNAYYLCIMLGFAYLMNFSRGIVRHSMFENITFVAFWCAFLYLSVGLAFYHKKAALVGIYFLGLVVVNQLLLNQEILKEQPVITAAASRENVFVKSWKQKENNYWGLLQEKVQRAVWSEELEANALPLETICELFLKEDETYAELLNKDFLYAVLLRESPMYMCQAPLLVSGEATQEALVNQIDTAHCPIVLLPSSQAEGFEVQTDGTANNVRNYKVMEYVYQNYRPLLCYDDTAVWCLQDRYEEYRSIAEEYMLSTSSKTSGYVPMELADYGYDGGNAADGEMTYYPFLHQYDLWDLAMLWGNFDKEEACKNPSLTVPDMNESGIYVFDAIEDEEKEKGNYLMVNMNDPEDEIYVCVELGIYEEDVFNEKYEYIYRTDSDMERYLIRISSDYYWYAEDINAVRIRDIQGNLLQDVSLDVLQGD